MGGRTTHLVPSHRAPEFRGPLTIPGGEIAGAEVVRELPDAFALTVWQTLRSVLAWAGGEPGLRGDLFEARAMAEWEVELLRGEWEEALRLPLAVIVGALGEADDASAERLARACFCVSEWALDHGASSTALAFAEAAALCWSENPRYAYTAGRLLRAYGRSREAEEWMRRTVRVALSVGDGNTHSLALNGLGNILSDRGRYREAMRIHQQALKLARRHRLPEREGEIFHDLFVATWYGGDQAQAEEYAREAFERYRHGHHRLASLAHDVAFSWMKRGHHARALSVLEALPERFAVPHERIRVLGVAAHAAGGCGNAVTYDRMAREIWSMAEAPEFNRGLATSLLDLALGATGLGRWDIAQTTLERALEIATERAEADVIARAEQAMVSVRERRAAGLSRNCMDTEPLPQLDSQVEAFLASLSLETAACV